MGKEISNRHKILEKQLAQVEYFFFKYAADIRRLIYTTNTIEGFHRRSGR